MDMSGAEQLSAKASAIVLQTANPHLAAEAGIRERYNASLRSEATEWYHIHEDVTTSPLWPQQILTYPLLTTYAVGKVAAQTISTEPPHKMPINQFVTLLRQNLACRIIRSFKNGGMSTQPANVANISNTSSYWFYDLCDQDGSVDFSVSCGFKDSTTEINPGKALAGCASLAAVMTADFAAATGVFGLTNAGTQSVINAWSTQNAKKDGPIAAAHAQGDSSDFPTTHYADAAANFGAAKKVGVGSASPAVAATPTAPQLGGILTGSYIFYWITPPTGTAGALVTASLTYLADNEGEPYTIDEVDISQALPIAANTTFASFSVPLDDYHKFRITINNAGLIDSSTTHVEFGIMYIGTGEGWSHLMTPDLDTVAAEIEMNSWIATSQLITNVTPIQYRGGLQCGIQPPQGTYWQTFVDNLDPFKTILTFGNTGYKAEAMDFTKGGYFFVRPADEEDYHLKTEVVQSSSISGFESDINGGRCFRVPLQDQTFAIHCIQNTALLTVPAPGQPIPIMNLLFHTDMVGEFTTPTQWRSPVPSETPEEAWPQSFKALKHMRQFFTNKDHNQHTVEAAKNAPPNTLETILQWVPHLLQWPIRPHLD